MSDNWNDGVNAELDKFLQDLSELAESARKIAEQVIDDEAKTYHKQIERKTPVKTGGLKASLTIERNTSKGADWYGYSVIYKGNAPNGQPYEKIAAVINYGTETRVGTSYISNATRKLKGMDKRIDARIEAELSKRT